MDDPEHAHAHHLDELRERFCRHLRASQDDAASRDDAASLLPDRLCRAAVHVLPFDGAGLSFGLRAEGRLPLGSSDAMAASAERLQFSTGTGPCSTVQRLRTPVLAPHDELQRRWPGYAAQLGARTRYRSTLSLPVGGPLTGAVVLDLYSCEPDLPSSEVVDDVRAVAEVIGAEIATDFSSTTAASAGMPAALSTDRVAARRQTSAAVRLLMQHHGVDGGTALALLRGLALGHELDVDTAADQVVRGRMQL